MRPRGIIPVGLALAVAGFVTPLAAQVTVVGVVREDGTERPLPGVVVLIEGTKREVTSDPAGRYRIDAPTGNRVALFRAIGYRPLRLRLQLIKGDSVTADATLVKEQPAQQLDPVVTTAAAPRPTRGVGVGLQAFEERRRLGFGVFFDSAQLRRAENRKLPDLFRGMAGVKMVAYVPDPTRPSHYEWRIVGRVDEMFGEPCWMSVLLDGSPVYRSGTSAPPPDFRREFTDVAAFQAVEVYRSAAEVPMEYGGSSEQCGLLLLWTRRGG